MSQYTKQQQLEIVQGAMNLQATIESEQARISTLQRSSFKAKPLPPVHQKAKPVQPHYPPIPQTNMKFLDYIQNDTPFFSKLFSKKGILAVAVALFFGMILNIVLLSGSNTLVLGLLVTVLCVLLIPAYIILFGYKYYQFIEKRKEINRQLGSAPEYLSARAEAERVAKQQEEDNQRKLDEQFEKATIEYQSVLEQYNQDLAEYEHKKSIELSILNQDLEANIDALAELYDTTRLIPKNNRSLYDLVWIYNDMNSSEHEFERSLDTLNADKQQTQTEELKKQVNDLTSVTSRGFAEVLDGIDYSNYQLEGMNDQLSDVNYNLGKVRRDINLGNLAAAAQRHSTNKKVKEANAKLDDLLSKHK